MRFAARRISNVVGHNNAVLGATQSGSFVAIRKQGGTCGGVYGRGVSTLIIVNNGNSLANTQVFTRRCSVIIINLPNAVSGSLCNASGAVNCSAAVGAVVRYISHVHSAYRDRRHVFFIRIVNHSTNFLTRGSTVTYNTRTTVVPRRDARISRLTRFVRENVHGSGGDYVIVISRDPGYNTVCCTRQLHGRLHNDSIHISVLNRLRHNNYPATESEVLTDEANINTVRTVLRNRHGIVMNIEGGRIICIPFARTVHPSGPFSGGLVGILSILDVWCGI